MEGNLFSAKLINHKIFDSFKKKPVSGGGNLKNLTEFKDDVLFVWNDEENCLLSLNVKNLVDSDEEQPYQKLHLTQPPAFKVERILCGACGTRLCIWGPRGVVIMELPTKWGRAGLFEGGKDTVLCKSNALDERFLYSQGEVRRVHWHPTSLSHVLVLVSDNTLRLYNIALKTGPKLVKILSLGSKPSGYLAGRTLLESLGDTAVDFTTVGDVDAALILCGNGDLYVIDLQLNSKSASQPKLRGPLTMYPQADDNYGSESCSIACLGGNPPLLVIATSCHVLYHCLLLPQPEIEVLDKKDDSGYALYVIESVELNVQLTPDDADLQYSYPVHLYTCPGNAGTYACVHAAGVHIVTLPIVNQLKEYMSSSNEDTETLLSSIGSMTSSARYSVCTGGVGERVQAALGFILTPAPLTEIALLCADGRLITRTLVPFDLEERLYKELQLQNPALEHEDIKKIFKERQKLSFSSIIQEILSREVSQPILNTNKSEEPTPTKMLEILTEATLKLRSEYMGRQQAAADAIANKLTSLRSAHRQQQTWCTELQNEIDDLKSDTEKLRAKLSLAENHQENIKCRYSTIFRKLSANRATSAAERELMDELQRCRATKELLQDHVRNLKLRAKEHDTLLEKWNEEYKKKDIALGKTHSETISSILQQQTCQIATLIDEAKELKEKLGIV